MSKEFYVEQIALLVKKGRSPDEIAQRLGKSLAFVLEMADHPDVIAKIDQMNLEDLRKDPEMWDKDRYTLEIQAMGPIMVREAFKMALNPSVSDATRAKMIELVLKHNENMPAPKEAESDTAPKIYIDEVVIERLEALEQARLKRAKFVGTNGTDGEDS